MKNLVVEKKYNGYKLVNYLQSNFSKLATSTIYKALRKKDILVNNIRIKENVKIFAGDKITLYISDAYLFREYKHY